VISASSLAAAGAAIAVGLLVVLAAVDGSSGANLIASTTATTVMTSTPSGSDAPKPALPTSTSTTSTSTTTTTTTTPSTTATSPSGVFDLGGQEAVSVPLRCLGIDADGVATFFSVDALDEVVRRRLIEIAAVVGADSGFVIDLELLANELADVRLDIERCFEKNIEVLLADEPERWPCMLAADLVLAGGADIDDVIDRYKIGCGADLSYE